MATEDNNIVTQIACMYPEAQVEQGVFEELTESICRRFSVVDAQISITIVDDNRISELNTEYLRHVGPTDVISFDLSDESGGQRNFEIIVNAQMAQRQAGLRGHSTEAELALYITHGLLHNLGFDDSDEDLAEKMHSEEDEILRKAGFGVVYHSRSKEE